SRRRAGHDRRPAAGSLGTRESSIVNREYEQQSLITVHRSPFARCDWVGVLAAATLTIIFSLLLLAHDPLLTRTDDYAISVLPLFADMARAWNHGEFPLLSPYSRICGNLAGEFQ